MELGKHGKLKGQKHPRDLRRIDPEPPRTTPGAKPHRKTKKRFGIAFEIKWPRFTGGAFKWLWEPRVRWFETERQRDQSLSDAVKKAALSKFERNHEKVAREELPVHPTENT